MRAVSITESRATDKKKSTSAVQAINDNIADCRRYVWPINALAYRAQSTFKIYEITDILKQDTSFAVGLFRVVNGEFLCEGGEN